MFTRSLLSIILSVVTAVLLVPVDLLAQNHLVTPKDLRSELRTASENRQRDLAKLEKLVSSAEGQKALASLKVDAAKVQKALPLLSDQELARLAAQADRAQADFAAGGLSLSTEQVTIIIIGVIIVAIIAIAAH